MIFQTTNERVVNRREVLVGFRCTTDEREVLDKRAKQDGMSLSDFMRKVVSDFLNKQEDCHEQR
jgi:uncharacterized protein (DUF1778 family)